LRKWFFKVVFAWVIAISEYFLLPVVFAICIRNSRFIILSMITGNFHTLWSQERIVFVVGLRRLLKDSAPVSRIGWYFVLSPVNLKAFPKLQNSIKPRSWVPLLYCSFSRSFSLSSPACFSLGSEVASPRYNKVPG